MPGELIACCSTLPIDRKSHKKNQEEININRLLDKPTGEIVCKPEMTISSIDDFDDLPMMQL